MLSLAPYIDHTNLKPAATTAQIEMLCQEAALAGFASVCVHPVNVRLAKRLLRDTRVKVCTVIGFPLGANTTASKVFETKDALSGGCDEFDMVLSIGALKDGRLSDVREEIAAVVAAAKGRCVKVIIETGLLTDEEKITATRLCCEAGASFVKTCTGFSTGIATVEDVRLIKAHVTGGVRVKASAGIKDARTAWELIEAGADRLGTSSGMALISSSR